MPALDDIPYAIHNGIFSGVDMTCYICGEESIKRHGRTNMCAKHNRFKQMQKTAKADKKYVPSFNELELHVPTNMKCPLCNVRMHWIDDENRSSGAILQHYRDGSVGITCASCNTKHGNMVGDSYKDLPSDHKLCNACKTIKPLSEFSKRREKSGVYPVSKCKACAHAAHVAWRSANPDRYKALNKKHNDKRKEKHDECASI